jgi:NAD(P)-dependent dehydrogenase (short-subunit alcohol dehydrogenase family)
MTAVSKAVLVTGCSSGIGRETAKRLAAGGWTVYATARRTESIEDLAQHGCKLLPLDVTDEESMRSAVQHVEEAEGAVGVLVNNAGINEIGAIETVPIDKVRRLYETNVFGPVRLAQLVLPGMRGQGYGKVVTVGSMNGRFTWPGNGFYCSTKHALEAISDALRFEVRPFGVDVVLIEPGFVKTPFGESAADRWDAEDDGPYASYNSEIAEVSRTYTQGARGLLACTADAVAAVVEKSITGNGRPRARYRVAPSATLMITTRKLLPDPAFDAFLRTQFPKPGA